MESKELNEIGTHEVDSVEGSDDTPMINPAIIPLIWTKVAGSSEF